MDRKVNVGLVQMRCAEDPEENVRRALAMTGQAASEGAEIVCLPELFRTPYFCKSEDHRNFKFAEPIPGPTTRRFEALAGELGITVLVSLFEKRAEGLYHNTIAVVEGDKGFVGRYRKMHIPDDPLFYEKFYFTPGDLGFRAFRTGPATIGTLICWDQWYPEAARLTAMRGAEILFYPTAIGWLPSEKATRGDTQREAWELVQRSHAVANGCYSVAVNRVGFESAPHGQDEKGIEFWGGSFVAGPDGSILAQAPDGDEAVRVVELNLGSIDALRTEWPFLRDRRIDAYADLSRRYIDDE